MFWLPPANSKYQSELLFRDSHLLMDKVKHIYMCPQFRDVTSYSSLQNADDMHTIIFTNLTCHLECAELIGSFLILTELLAVPPFSVLLEIITDCCGLILPRYVRKINRVLRT